MTRYRETRSGFTATLTALGCVVPFLVVGTAVVLGIAVSPAWFALAVFFPMLPPFLATISLFLRNRSTGIEIDEQGVTVGVLGGARHGRYRVPWTSVRTARIERDGKAVDALMRSRRLMSRTRWWGIPRGMAEFEFSATVLVPPGARAALVLELADLSSVEAVVPRPSWYFGNWTNVGYFSRRREPKVTSTWIVPTRRPDRLAEVLSELGVSTSPST